VDFHNRIVVRRIELQGWLYGTYPPIVLKQDASSIPVALVPLSGSGLNESQLKDIGQNFVHNQLASVAGASVPQPFGGRWR
jgi:multidrug efflux pump subunit AcrB